MESSYLFADSDLSSSVCDPPAPAADHCPADVVALRRLSEHLGALRRSSDLGFCSDARITVGSAAAGDPPREVRVHRCVLAARSPFFRERFAQGATQLELGDLVKGFEVGFEALGAVLDYVYTGRVGPLPKGVCECVDEECDHVACWPAVDFMLQVLFASATFQISELVSLFQRHLLDMLEKVATDDMLVILRVANLCGKACSRLLQKCVEIVVKSDMDNVTLEKALTSDIVKQIMKSRSNPGLHGPESVGFPDKNVKSIYRALDSDDIELVKLLLDEGHTNLDDAYALHYAVTHCDSQITAKLLDLERADVNRKNRRGYTVLHIAAMRKEPTIIVSLLTKGARPSDLTSHGQKAIQISKRHTRYIDYERPNEEGKAACNDKLCIEVLDQAERREEMALPLAMISGDPHQKLSYLEARVTLAKLLFPKEAKVAMDNAHVDGTLEYNSNLSTGSQRMTLDSDRTPFKMKEEYLSRMRALYRTVELGMRFFPRCSRVLNKIVDDDLSEFAGLEHITSEERKRRYLELQDEMMKAFSQDREELPRSALPTPSSKSLRVVRTKLAKK
ncbi:BTB/POZ domain and ankyrin repeat-containing protein NPR1-like [Phoenix dactylifera]|uniref:BTB/POZ domain and ankyrin repeat-containing protein NPR1-like n=1 Tax=Phoenix dactylifera TaxID=42345 RepID=A0A8B9ANH7_PHODC|nr:BTB/POZ domain and ankyrin repeat-containing protein NPR1-like [Phoenix dactylifera]